MKNTIFSLVISITFVFMTFIFLSCKDNSVKENVISVSIGGEPQTIDPTLSSALDSIIYSVHTFEGLTTKDKDNNVAGGVAEKWEVSKDGLNITFHIRSNAKWSDGKPVSANDFVYAWRRAVNPNTGAPYSFLMSPLKNASSITAGKMPVESLGVEALDDNTLLVTLESPTAYFMELTSVPVYYPIREDIVATNETWTLNADTYIVNGPYVVKERRTDELIALELNTNYWNKDSIKATKINFVLLSDPTTSLAALKEGSIQYSTKPPVSDFDSLKKEGLLVITPSLGTAYYALNNTNDVLKDKRVRKALALAIDRNYIVENITKGGETPAAAFIPPGLKDVKGDFRENGGNYFSVSKEDYDKNVEEAKALLKEAGYPDGKGLPVLEFKTNPGTAVIIAEAVQEMWKSKLNVDMTITQEEWAVFQKNRQTKQYVLCRADWIGDYLDPMTFAGLFISSSSGNRVGYKNAEYDRLIAETQNSIDNSLRMSNMHKAEDMLIGEDMALIPIYYYTSAAMQDKNLKGVLADTLEVRRFFYAYLDK